MSIRAVLSLLALLAVVVTDVPPVVAQAQPPVDGEVIDPFRPPEHIGAPGNRGWEYATTPGSPVRAALGGVVAFAGQVGGTLHVSIDHPGGLRTSYSFLSSVDVVAGQMVTAGTPVGRSADRFHFGLRRDGVYVDPATIFGAGPAGPPRLFPRPGRVPGTVATAFAPGRTWDTIPLHSPGGPTTDHLTIPPRATHGRRVSGAGSGIR